MLTAETGTTAAAASPTGDPISPLHRRRGSVTTTEVGVTNDASLGPAEIEVTITKTPLERSAYSHGETTVTIGTAELVLKGEDNHAVRATQVAGESLFIGLVADGHGGKAASRLCKRVVIDDLLERLSKGGDASGKAVRAAGRGAFRRAHEEVLADPATTAGSTLTVCVLNQTRHEVTTLHSGDSVARLVMHHGTKCVPLCEDHRIDSSPSERERLTAMGGKIARAMNERTKQPQGPLRLYPGGVAQARAIGDRDVGAFIDAKPHAQTVALGAAETCCVVVASDGVWDALETTAVDACARRGLGGSAASTASAIVNASLVQRSAYSSDGDMIPRDDTTCIVLLVAHAADPVHGGGGGGCCA